MGHVRVVARLALIVLACGGIGWGASQFTASPPAANETEPRRVHKNGKALAEGLLEVTAALLRDDAKAARTALDRMEEACRRLPPEEDEFFGSGILILDRALHKVLSGSREYSGAGEVERAFDEFVWVQRTCRQCHALAREQGLLPKTGPLWQTEDN